MKKLFVFAILLSTFAFGQINYYPQFVTDTVRFIRSADTLVYADGDIIADSGSHNKYFRFDNIGTRAGSRGKIIKVTVQMDTANATNTTVKLRLFSVSDTTGLWGAFPADNATFQSKFQIGGGSYLWFDNTAVTLAILGTTAGGATSSEGVATPAIPYTLLNGKLYGVLIATGAFEPKDTGTFRIIIQAERQQ